MLLTFLSCNSDVHLMLGEEIVCATVSPHLYIIDIKHSPEKISDQVSVCLQKTAVYSLTQRTFVESAQNLTPEKFECTCTSQHITRLRFWILF